MTRLGLLAPLLPAVLAAAVAGCNDPVHDDAVAALGPEAPGVPPGPLHRPGQPCLTCHDGTGPASMVFGTAGTVFQDPMNPTPLVAATVQLTDTNMLYVAPQTNCAGNFFVEDTDWSPAYPVKVQVFYGGMNAQMISHMGKSGSCADCHVGTTATQTSTVQVYMSFDPMSYPPSGCPQ